MQLSCVVRVAPAHSVCCLSPTGPVANSDSPHLPLSLVPYFPVAPSLPVSIPSQFFLQVYKY
ncbi:hypothetical protein K469DRAFT_715471 [Zopfia rhizophila CBS 207.26]|uniref:Uncharacterized protein n=1 Tax=Zopfia rhizophila CBS 207.26 TaxID=1314779 RepID=A0A6A6DP82_9PEZI|nr:hypothetical protein K469DRAFT_715471 [Zopfia rhizophila CBS 207.26]